jgi:hypothetical protein
MKRIGLAGCVMLVIGVGACGGSNDTNGKTTGAVTFWGDVEPIFSNKCVKCHQSGGIGPFRLDDYATAKAYAPIEKVRVNQGTMPPYFMVHDGSCQTFQDDPTLSADQIATITAWVDGGTPEGTRPSTVPTPPTQPTLPNASSVSTPTFMPMPQGGELAQFDEYRCFLLDFPHTGDTFITGYDVSPGDAAIVHHVLGFVVDPNATGAGGLTNAQIMANLQAQSPDRIGWPCFGAAGDGVNVGGLPIAWAPGQGIVEYPTGMGVPVKATDKFVVQVHYNLADPATLGQTDSTAVHMQFADSVQRQLRFLLPDPFLGTVGNKTPDTLPPGQADTKYTWTLSGSDMGIKGVPSVDLMAVMPHMHQRGVRQTMNVGTVGNMSCASHLENWSFHWQEFYSYKAPIAITPDTQISVTCEYNTSTDTQPVLPGWGTRNEMCLNVLMVALPAQQ